MEYVTAFVALVVAVIAFMQWNTARQKVILDLFEKRFEVYQQIRDVLASVVTQTTVNEFIRLKNRASFLFGNEVGDFLNITRRDLIEISVARDFIKQVPPNEEQAEAERLLARADRMSSFFVDFDKLVAPYMKHTQKQFPYLIGGQLD